MVVQEQPSIVDLPVRSAVAVSVVDDDVCSTKDGGGGVLLVLAFSGDGTPNMLSSPVGSTMGGC
jgi:hypothetical protein